MGRQPRIGQRLAAARLQRGLAQALVARRAGIAASYLSRIENGKVQPTFRTLQRVARAIGAPLDEVATAERHTRQPGGNCPITAGGDCLLDLIRSDTVMARESPEEHYSVRQLKLLRGFARWLQTAAPERLNALEVLLEELERSARLDS